ncbi:MAG: 3-dehydroquinate synthase [Gemmatimonadetes bacterium]|nr:3-dehydroquinate synthase [Gemmatimonadota bacterium]
MPPDAVLRQRIAVEYRYDVHFTHGAFAAENRTLADVLAQDHGTGPHRVYVVVEEQVRDSWPGLVSDIRAYARAHAAQFSLAADPLIARGGEEAKNRPELVAQVQASLNDAGIDRHSYVLCIGGGALQDAVGFAAATAHRGVRMVRLPTTVLAQNDSGVGVKNAINAFGKKNFLGTFAPPFAVINDARFLETLPPRERVAGMSEAVKVALIRDAEFFGWLRRNSRALSAGDAGALQYLIRRCAELHLRHIGTSGDPFEFGSARPLDFGHWAAHRLESMTGYRLRHGEAVAIGMAIDTLYSELAGYLAPGTAGAVLGLLRDLGLPLWDEALREEDAVLRGLEEFREHLGGELTVTLLRGIGQGFEVHRMDERLVRRAIHQLDPARAA